MSSSKINVDKLANVIVKRLEAYGDVTQEIVERAVTNTAKLAADEINENAAELFNGKKYSRSWSYKKDASLRGIWKYSMVVYSKAPYYRLAHLLEHGHAKVKDGYVDGRPHIAPVQQIVERDLETYIIEGIKAIK